MFNFVASFKLGSMMAPDLSHYFKLLAIQSLLWFHVNFLQLFLSIFTNAIELFIGIFLLCL